MSSTRENIVLTLKVITIFVTLISGIYLIFIPTFTPNYSANTVLLTGVAAAALAGAYIGYQAANEESWLIKLVIALCYAAITTVLVLCLSLFIMHAFASS